MSSPSTPKQQHLNPEWKEAIEKAMHVTLMSKPPPEQSSPSSCPSDREAPQETMSKPLSDSDSDSVISRLDEASVSPVFSAPPRKPATPRRGATFSPSSSSTSSLTSSRPVSPDSPPTPPPPPPRRRPPSTPPPPRSRPAPKKPSPPKPSPRVSKHQMEMEKEEKLELLARLQHYTDEKGFRPFRSLGPDDPIEDIRYEVFRAKRDQDKKRNIKWMQKGLVTLGTGIEVLNRRFDPLGLHLDGYSKSLLMSIRDYDEIFEEIHWKYCDAVAMPVEMKLVVTLASSIWFFHMSQGSASSPTPPPPPPPPTTTTTTNKTEAQVRMSGPQKRADTFPSPVMSMDMGNLMSGMSMMQTLLASQAP